MSVSRAATSPAVHDSAVAIVAPRARAASSTSSASGRSSSLNTSAPSRSRIASTSRSRASLAPCGARTRISTSERRAQIVVVVPASSPPASANACATTDSLTPKTRSRLRSSRSPARSAVAAGCCLDHRPHLRELGGRPGKDDDRRGLPRDDQTGRGADREDDVRTSRDERLLLDAVSVLRGRDPAPAGVLVHDLGDPRAQGLVDAELAPAHAGDGRDRAIVVRRPETARGDDDGVPTQRAQAVGDLVLAVTDEQHALELEPEAIERLGEEDRVAIRDEPEQQLAPRDQDRGRRPRTRAQQPEGMPAGARVETTPSAVTFHGPPPGPSAERLAVDRQRQHRGVAGRRDQVALGIVLHRAADVGGRGQRVLVDDLLRVGETPHHEPGLVAGRDVDRAARPASPRA